MWSRVTRELAGAWHCLSFTEGNSNAQKVTLWVGLALGVVLVLGVAFGFVNYDALPSNVRLLIDGFVLAIVYLFGRTHGREVELQK